MTETINQYSVLDDQLFDVEVEDRVADMAAVSLQIGALVMDFATIERVPRYREGHRENDVEHSYMLDMLVTEIIARYYPHLDQAKASGYCKVHDLPEKLTGDIATFTLDESAIIQKEHDDWQATAALLPELPLYLRHLLYEYELQTTPEARLVKLYDKITPVLVDILGPGKQVMLEDYDITTVEQLDANEDQLQARLRRRFPETDLQEIHAVRNVLALQFSKLFASQQL